MNQLQLCLISFAMGILLSLIINKLFKQGD